MFFFGIFGKNMTKYYETLYDLLPYQITIYQQLMNDMQLSFLY
jgi:hypothetical protein